MEQLAASCGTFGLLNSGVLSAGGGAVSQKQRAVRQKEVSEAEHRSTLEATRRSADTNSLRAELLKLEGRLKQARQELTVLDGHVRRHAGREGTASLRQKYGARCDAKRDVVRKLEEQHRTVSHRLQINQSHARLQLF